MDRLTVLIGDSEPILIEYVSELIEGVVGDDCKVEVSASHEADELLALAESRSTDLFVLCLNNVLFPAGNMPPAVRIQQALRLISDLKERFDRPIIALSGLPQYTRQATMVGADYSFDRPFDLDDFRDAVKGCLPDIKK